MRALTVFLAPDGPADGVLDVLVDLSAAGLVDPFLWVRGSQVAHDGTIGATAVGGGLRGRTTLGDKLLDEEHDRVRLCVIVPVACGPEIVGHQDEQRVVNMLTFNGDAPVSRIRCLVARRGSVAPETVVARLGWHNILVAPEEAYGPAGQRIELAPSTDPAEVGPHAAPVIAGVVGLWTGVDDCPLDGPAQEGLRAARAFYRRIDADAVEQELRAQVLATGPLLPVPRGWGDPVVHLNDATEACRDMADRLWQRHAHALIGPREAPRKSPPVRLTWRSALGWLLRFIGAALRNWPADWMRGKQTEQAVKSARRLQDVVLGKGDSAYTVVVHGMTKDNVPAGWMEYGAASAAIDERLVAAGLSRHQQPAELAEMWADFRNGAFALIDAGDRSGMPPRQLSDGRRAILRVVDDAVPAPEQRFSVAPGQVAALVDVKEVQAGDVLGARLLRDRLEHLIRAEPMQATAAGSVIHELTDWATAHDRGYAVQVGKRLAGALLGTVAEIQRHLQVLVKAGAGDGSEPAVGSKAVSRLIRILGALAVLGLIAGPALRLADVVDTRWAVVIAACPVVLWLGVAIGTFVNQQRRIFHDLNRRVELTSDVEAAEANLRQAVIDVRRLQDAYEQYLAWSRVLGAVLHRPYGPPVTAQAATARIVRGLPRTTRVAQALTDAREVGAAAQVLRADQFELGWLGALWELHLRDAVYRLDLHQFAEQPHELVRLNGRRVAETPLWAWAQLLDQFGTARAAGDAAWAARLSSLDGPRRELGGRLLSSVRAVEDGDHGPVSLERFLAAVDQPEQPGLDREFAPGHFSAEAQTQMRTGVQVRFPQRSRVGLSRVVTVVQLGYVLAPWEFAVTANAREPKTVEVPLPPVFPEEPGPWAAPVSPSASSRPVTGDLVPPAPEGFA